MSRGELWSFVRTVLERGAAIQQDYAAGNHASYEAYSARMDAAARELADSLSVPAALVAPLNAAGERVGPAREVRGG